MNRYIKFKNNPLIVLKFLLDKMSPFIKDDVFYVKVRYFLLMHEILNLKSPITYRQKLQWLKVYYHNPLYTKLVDKADVKDYVAKKIGKQYVIPTLHIYNCVEDIDFDKLPNKFVLKCTHDSGGLVVCKDKSMLNIEKAKQRLKKSLAQDYYKKTREWPYKNVPKRIIAEKYMEDSTFHDLRDYKFFCFDGIPRLLFISLDRDKGYEEMTIDFFDMEFNNLHIKSGHANADIEIPKPKCFEEMKRLASQLSQGMPHVRVDFYEVDGHAYFGEYTFFNNGGHRKYEPDKWNYIMGNWINLPEKMQ